MEKFLGYVFMGIGMLVLIAKLVLRKIAIPVISSLETTTAVIIGVLIMIAGLLFLRGGNKKKEVEEIPIYEGTGKNRRIVGLQRLGK